jgi:hypothetical protein
MQRALADVLREMEAVVWGAVNGYKRKYLQVSSGYNQGLTTWFS